jgi:HEAT repeat protein
MGIIMRDRCVVLVVLAMFLAAQEGRSAEPDPEIADAEKTLKDAGVSTENAALLKFFQDRLITDEDRERLKAAIKELGDDSFVVRERAEARLIEAGRAALPMLRAAQNHRDPEVAGRVQHCLEKLDDGSEYRLTTAATRLLSHRKPEGATKALLDFLPLAEDSYLQDSIFASLVILSVKDGMADELIKSAVESKVVERRCAAAFVLSRAGEQDRKLANKLLQDAEPSVRFQAATGLLRAGVKEAVPEVMRLLTDAPAPFAYQAEDLLYRLPQDKAPTDSLSTADEASRKKARAAWEAWWKDNADKVDLAKAKLDNAVKGLTIICELNGRVWECSKDGKKTWEINKDLSGPTDACVLPGGHVLIAEYHGSRVTERDRDGKILWTHATNGNPVSCQRLANGNTLIASSGEIVEVTRDHKVVLRIPGANGTIWTAYKGKDGKILYCEAGGDVVEADAAGKRLRSVKVGGLQSWGDAELLANGNVLVAKYNDSQVVEVDWTGKVVWQAATPNPTYASRLPNGNVLSSRGGNATVAEIDRNGKDAWTQATNGNVFRARRY